MKNKKAKQKNLPHCRLLLHLPSCLCCNTHIKLMKGNGTFYKKKKKKKEEKELTLLWATFVGFWLFLVATHIECS